MARLRISRSARADLNEIFVYIAKDSLESARRLHQGFQEKFKLLVRQPAIGRKREELRPGMRSLPLGNYVIFYQEMQGVLVILRVLHGARDVQQVFD